MLPWTSQGQVSQQTTHTLNHSMESSEMSA